MKRLFFTLVLGCFLQAPAWAAEGARGRTDGAEGSEVGKGGYSGLTGDWALGARLGAAACINGGCGTPLLLGAHLDYIIDDWAILETGVNLYPNGNAGGSGLNMLTIRMAGKFRAVYDPLAFYALVGGEVGTQAHTGGASDSGFGFVYGVGADFLVSPHLEAGLGVNMNQFVGNVLGDFNEYYMNLGYRF